jgi:hypothetical protein
MALIPDADAPQDSPGDDFDDRTGDSDISAPTEASPKSTVICLPSLIRSGARELVSIYGADRNERWDLVFTVLFKGTNQTSTVAHA